MSAGADDLTAGWLTRFRRGVVAGATVVLLCLIALCVPALLAWLMPGGDSLSATTACRIAGLTMLAGLRAGVTVQATILTVPPLLVTALVVALLSGPARRIDGRSGPAGLVAGFTAAAMAVAWWSRVGTSYASVHRTAAAALVVSLVVVVIARGLSRLRALVGSRGRRILCAGLAAALTQLLAGTLLVAGSLLVHFSDAVAIQRAVAPGGTGLAVALLSVAAIPNAGALGAAYLSGAGFHLGADTSVSVLSTHRGTTPLFPLLAALPRVGGLSMVGLVLAILGAVAVGRAAVAVLGTDRGTAEVVTDVVGAAAVAGILAGVVATFAHGDLGHAAMRGIGASGLLVASCSAATVLTGTVAAWGLRSAVAAPLAARRARRAGSAAADPAEAGLAGTGPAETEAPAEVVRDEPAALDESVDTSAGGGLQEWDGRDWVDVGPIERPVWMDTDELPDLSEAASPPETGTDQGDGPLRHAG